MKQPALTTLIILLLMPMNSQGDETYRAAKQYALEIDGCGLDHGYNCIQQQEDDFIGIESDQRMVPGNYLKAWQVAVADFLEIEDLEPTQKDLKHYKFGFTESGDHYIVHFQALLLPEITEGEVTATIRGTYGLTMRYWINKRSMVIDKRLFYKT